MYRFSIASRNISPKKKFTKLIAVVLILFSFLGSTFAQTYSIRVAYRTNLRATHSLDAALVETVPAGAFLYVFGSHNRWLKIERRGTFVWMAEWVAHERVDADLPAPAPSDIDNCCFVDRHCQTDQEWTDGYWAYQNNQCGTPQSTTPIAPGITFTGREGLPPIFGDEAFINAVTEGFNYLRNYRPNWFNFVSIIDEVKLQPDRCGGSLAAAACAGVPLNVVYFTSYVMENNTTAYGIASLLIHEACHLHQWREGRGDGYAHDVEGYEAECFAKQRRAGL